MQCAVRDMLGWEGEEEELRLKKLQKGRTLEAIVNALAMSGESEEVTRLRKPRFSYEENQILIREVRSHYSMLYGAQARRLSVAERRRVWEGIADKINAITNWKRTAQEVQKRWNDFKRRTKEKLARVPHSTQNGTAEEVLTAEEETIFAILGPGVVPGHELYIPHSGDLHLPAPGSSSAENSLSGPCCPPDPPLLLQPKQSSSPTPQIHIVQLPQLSPSPGPSEGASPAPMAPGSTSPLLSPGAVSQHYDPTVAMLRAQQETAEAIRHLTYTLRQSMDRLTNVLAAILPLIPPQPPSPAPSGLIEPVYYPTKTEPESQPCSVNYEVEGNHNGQEEGSGEPNVVEVEPSPPTSPPPQQEEEILLPDSSQTPGPLEKPVNQWTPSIGGSIMGLPGFHSPLPPWGSQLEKVSDVPSPQQEEEILLPDSSQTPGPLEKPVNQWTPSIGGSIMGLPGFHSPLPPMEVTTREGLRLLLYKFMTFI